MNKRMKHRRRFNRRKSRRARASQPSVQSPRRSPVKSLLAKFPRWFWLTVALIGLLASIRGLVGPYWPTVPTFSPGYPSRSSPLDIPFEVTNESVVFPVKNLKIRCLLLRVFAEDGLQIVRTQVYDNIASRLLPDESRSYRCKFSGAISLGPRQFTMVQIQFLTEYQSILPWKTRTQSVSDAFTLDLRTDPPQWTRGTPLP